MEGITQTFMISPLFPGGLPVAPSDISKLPDWLQLMSGPVGWLAIGVFVTLLLRKIVWYNQQSSEVKQVLQIGLTILLSVASYSIYTYVPQDALIAFSPVFAIVYGIIAMWTATEGSYLTLVKPNK